MSQDNSEMSKVIIKYILTGINNKKLSKKQTSFLDKKIPKEIQGIGEDIEFKNATITSKNNRIYKINYNKSSDWITFNGWQRSPQKIAKDLNVKYLKCDSTKKIFNNILKKVGLQGYVEYLFKSANTIDNLLMINKDISDLKNIPTDDLVFEIDEIDSDIMENLYNKNTFFISINGMKLIQVQVPASNNIIRKNSHIARINKKLIYKFIKNQKNNNETWGISVEVAICELYNIDIPIEYNNRYNNTMVEEAKIKISELKGTKKEIFFTQCLATKQKGKKKSPTDFLAKKEKISVKTNINSNNRVCPPGIGQPGISEGLKFYNSIFSEDLTHKNLFNNNLKRFKKLFIQNIHIIFEKQLEKLFSEDKIFYMRKTKRNIDMKIIDTKQKTWKFKLKDFTFTRYHKEWNESTSIHYKGISVAEMQIHKNRSPFKFRFNLLNLLKILEKND